LKPVVVSFFQKGQGLHLALFVFVFFYDVWESVGVMSYDANSHLLKPA